MDDKIIIKDIDGNTADIESISGENGQIYHNINKEYNLIKKEDLEVLKEKAWKLEHDDLIKYGNIMN